METTHKNIEDLHLDALPRAAQRALIFLSEQPWLKRSKWYLAGGTALTLQIGHRKSVDLDFFLPKKNFSTHAIQKHFPDTAWIVDRVDKGTVYGRIFGGKVSFIAYPFFIPQDNYTWFGAVRILTPPDIATMKIVAISQRGRKRDFVDLYWYCMNREPLVDVMLRLPKQYPTVAHDYHHILKSIVYFDDADADAMPELYFKTDWQTIKKYFEREVPRISKLLLKVG